MTIVVVVSLLTLKIFREGLKISLLILIEFRQID